MAIATIPNKSSVSRQELISDIDILAHASSVAASTLASSISLIPLTTSIGWRNLSYDEWLTINSQQWDNLAYNVILGAYVKSHSLEIVGYVPADSVSYSTLNSSDYETLSNDFYDNME